MMELRLTLLQEKVGKQGTNNLHLYQCSCGNTVTSTPYNVYPKGKARSCGCIKREMVALKNQTHGLSKSNPRLYRIWKGMRSRCHNPNGLNWMNYGGRGIAITPDWDQFEVFCSWALTNGYADNLTIDRRNVDGGYSSENCQWITQKEQCWNTRLTLGKEAVKDLRARTYKKGDKKALSKELGVNYSTIKNALRGKTYQFTNPAPHTMTLEVTQQ